MNVEFENRSVYHYLLVYSTSSKKGRIPASSHVSHDELFKMSDILDFESQIESWLAQV